MTPRAQGSALTAALWLGLKREKSARFSFFLGLPAIALAGVKEIWELHHAHLPAHGWSILFVGLVVASMSAYCAIWALMAILERVSAWPFVAYRALLGILILVLVGQVGFRDGLIGSVLMRSTARGET